jgi:hypothetical protein
MPILNIKMKFTDVIDNDDALQNGVPAADADHTKVRIIKDGANISAGLNDGNNTAALNYKGQPVAATLSVDLHVKKPGKGEARNSRYFKALLRLRHVLAPTVVKDVNEA